MENGRNRRGIEGAARQMISISTRGENSKIQNWGMGCI